MNPIHEESMMSSPSSNICGLLALSKVFSRSVSNGANLSLGFPSHHFATPSHFLLPDLDNTWLDSTCQFLEHCSAHLEIPAIPLLEHKRRSNKCIIDGFIGLGLSTTALQRFLNHFPPPRPGFASPPTTEDQSSASPPK
jgi:hypothetical protein